MDGNTKGGVIVEAQTSVMDPEKLDRHVVVVVHKAEYLG